jgi:hypothetical protein
MVCWVPQLTCYVYLLAMASSGWVHDTTYHVMQPVRTFGLLALVFFFRGSGDEDDGLLALLLSSTLERLE